ncbi:glycosyltransferase [Halalkalicoccus tibetensis]|uniref:Glycosyltransferase n=1 Tax=Halalkalicoccus tibetensis TaxID=175632 RepID=A0ABD5V5Z1_9EURY
MSSLLNSIRRGDAGDEPEFPSTSIVIEWENVIHAKESRSEAMLRGLNAQLNELEDRFPETPEIIFVYNPDDVEESQIRHFASLALDDRYDPQFVASPGSHFYELKNVGAQRATGDVLVYVDSDVIPQEGWLDAIVSPFLEEGTDMVLGHPFVETDTRYKSAVAMFWFFPAEHEEYEGYMACNVAFDRESFLEHEFPEEDSYRGQCVELKDRLEDSEKGLQNAPNAKVSHPAMNGFDHFLNRAVCSGYDSDYWYRYGEDPSRKERAKAAVSKLEHRARQVGYNVLSRRDSISDDPATIALALLLGASYYSLEFLARLVTIVRPELIERNFQI